nr:hypothetical protein [Tanacetum cinerariifolium]
MNDKFEAYTNANDSNMNDMQLKLNNFQKNQQDFQKKFEQKQDDFQNQMRNFMQNLYDRPPGEDKEHEATKDTELPSTKDIQPLPIQEPPQNSDMRQLIRDEVVHKSSTSFKNTSQISSIHAIAPILSTKEPEHLLRMGYEHLSITPEMESDEVTESNAENLLPIPIYDDDFEDIEYVEASLLDHDIFSIEEEHDVHQEEENVVQRQQEEEIDLEDISQIQDVVLHNFSPEFKTFCDHSEETRSGNTTHADNSLLEYDSFCFEIEPDQERLINLMKNDIPDNSSNNSLLEEID